jgi:hypothetical protein
MPKKFDHQTRFHQKREQEAKRRAFDMSSKRMREWDTVSAHDLRLGVMWGMETLAQMGMAELRTDGTVLEGRLCDGVTRESAMGALALRRLDVDDARNKNPILLGNSIAAGFSAATPAPSKLPRP